MFRVPTRKGRKDGWLVCWLDIEIEHPLIKHFLNGCTLHTFNTTTKNYLVWLSDILPNRIHSPIWTIPWIVNTSATFRSGTVCACEREEVSLFFSVAIYFDFNLKVLPFFVYIHLVVYGNYHQNTNCILTLFRTFCWHKSYYYSIQTISSTLVHFFTICSTYLSFPFHWIPFSSVLNLLLKLVIHLPSFTIQNLVAESWGRI